MKIVKAPEPLLFSYPRPWLFLAGSIEMGVAVNWQERVAAEFADEEGTILNPRRDDWDASWVQDINNKQFYNQVTWELKAQQWADIILMHFEPDTKSPITLLELGLAVERQNEKGQLTIVHCPEGFWRKGNVDIVCRRYHLDQVDTIEDLIKEAKAYL